MTIRYEQGVRVTPRMAREWLQRNADNQRNPKLGRIPGYARDMATGRWRPNTGETIKFDPEGYLIDGQNRLLAVIEADNYQEFVGWVVFDIAYDVPRDAMLVLDTGASRTYADSISVHKGGDGRSAVDRNRASSIVRWVESWDAGFPMNSGTKSYRTNSELDEAFNKDPDLYAAATKRAKDAYVLGLGAVGPVGTAFVLFHRIDPGQCHQFFDAVIGGANLPPAHPALLLRNRMGRIKVDRITRQEVLALYIRAWNWVRRGETPKNEKLQISKGDLSNASFPRPM